MAKLQDSLCKVFNHDWDYLGSGEVRRPKCLRCNMDWVEYLADMSENIIKNGVTWKKNEDII